MTFFHQIPGRLRLKFPELKSRKDLCQAVEKAIRTLPMVRLVQVNVVTGSLLVHYDGRGAQQSNLLKAIQDILCNQFGLVLPNAGPEKTAANDSHGQNNALANALVERVSDMIVEKIVERSALALLGILI